MDKIKPGRYIVAVSGGVDSMVLLDMLRRQSDLELIVAHADHGQRPDSPQDIALVRAYCQKNGLTFVTNRLDLPLGASEDQARKARWDFLRQCSKKFKANAIITAHHQDDLIETALIAIFRGTGWRGLAPFTHTPGILRPLLNVSKNDLISYARRHSVPWREDFTNADERYLRNYLRHTIIPLIDQKSSDWRDTFLQYIRKQQQVRPKIEAALTAWLISHQGKAFKPALTHYTNLRLPRYDLIMAPHSVAYELLQQAFRLVTGNSVERPLGAAAVLFTKVARPGKLMQLGNAWQLRAESANVIVEPRPDMLSLNKH